MKYWFWIQLTLFQLLWFVAVMGQNEWVAVALLLLTAHFMFSPERKKDLIILPVALVGLAIDALLTVGGVFAFSSFPFWLIILWGGFVVSLSHSLAWLKKMPAFFLALFSGLMGTLSYLAGWKLEAVELPLGILVTSAILAVVWGLLLPLLLRLDSRIRRGS